MPQKGKKKSKCLICKIYMLLETPFTWVHKAIKIIIKGTAIYIQKSTQSKKY